MNPETKSVCGWLVAGGVLALSAGLGGCAGGRAATVAPASEAQRAELLDRVKTLAGEWEMTGPDGKPMLAAVFAVSANGSTVREIMFPGSEHEMTNMYHMDGPSLVMTHYCAMGNQPRLRATRATGNQIAFGFDSVTNKTAADQSYMGEMTVTFVDQNNIVQDWRSLKNGKPLEEHAKFELTRKR